MRGNYDPHHTAIAEREEDVRALLGSCTEDLTPITATAAWSASIVKADSWKAPGPDKLHAFWYKAFPGLTGALGDLLFGLITDPGQTVPGWFVRGRTVLIPKSPGAKAPDRQRPITCLNTGYKLLTGALTVILRGHVSKAALLPLEQKALRKGARGCLDALAIDTAIMEEVQRGKKSLAVAWIDFKKAFDQVPHKWLKRCLKTIKAPKMVRRAVRQLVPLWQMDLEVQGREGLVRVPVTFRRGLFQGDSLSPLLFCLAVSPVSAILRRGDGYESPSMGKVTHLFYMDDLKLYEEDSEELDATVEQAEAASGAVGMQLGAQKCGVAHFRKGRIIQRGGVATRLNQIKELTSADSYK